MVQEWYGLICVHRASGFTVDDQVFSCEGGRREKQGEKMKRLSISFFLSRCLYALLLRITSCIDLSSKQQNTMVNDRFDDFYLGLSPMK